MIIFLLIVIALCLLIGGENVFGLIVMLAYIGFWLIVGVIGIAFFITALS